MKLRDIFAFRDPPESETSKPFLEHLEDLRWTIVKMAIVLIVAMFLCFAFRQRLVLILQRPLSEVGGQIGALRALGITDSITISFHLAFYAGIVISFPLLLYFLAQFVLPALTAVEKRFLFPAIVVSFGLFLTGVASCYHWLLPKTILFFFHDTQSLGWTPMWTVQQYYSFVTRFVLGFGLAFELPVVVLALVKFGLVTYQFMARTRPYAIVLIFILATIITPTPDVLTLIAHEPAHVPALRELHLDCVVHAAQSRPRRIALTSGHVRGVRTDFPRLRLRTGRGHRVFPQRLHLPVTARSFSQPAAPLVLSIVQEAYPVVSQSAVAQLALAAREMRELREQDRFPLFRR